MLLKDNNPWKGLASYSYSDAKLFFGRERELDSLILSIRENYCTILYGVSGAGKTSLINAGLCPRLKRYGFLPIVVRLDHSSHETYSRQILKHCIEQLSLNDCDYESSLDIAGLDISDTNKLWLFFHTSTFWSSRNEKITPCVFIDQFEEIFSLNQETPDKISSFFDDFNQVYQSIPSDILLSAFNENVEPLSYNDRPSFRLALSMREDFLSSLEDYCLDIPFLRQNRRRLNKLTGEQAFDVITKPLSGLVEKDAAFHIISKVSGRFIDKSGTNLDRIEVDTSILSLFCSELYGKAIEGKRDTISTDLVQSQGDDILTDFYNNTIGKISRKAVRYLESHLLTSSGYRNQLALEDIDSSKVSEKEIELLESTRVIRKEVINGTTRIEFSHDVLCKIASAHRISSLVREKSGWDTVSSVIKWLFSFVWLWLLYKKKGNPLLRWAISDNSLLFPFGDNAFFNNLAIFFIYVLLLLSYWGIISLSSKKKNIFFSFLVFSLATVFFLLILHEPWRVYYIINGRTHFCITPWLLLSTFISFVFSLVCPGTKVGLISAFRNAYSLKRIRVDKSRRYYIVASLFVFTFFIVYRSTIIKIPSLTIVTLFLLLPVFLSLFALLGDNELFFEFKKRDFLLFTGCALIVLLFYFSNYTHLRILTYVCLAIMFWLSFYFSQKAYKKQEQKHKWVCLVSCLAIWILAPIGCLGFSIFSLGSNSLTSNCLMTCSNFTNSRTVWEITDVRPRFYSIVSKEGLYGIISNKGILIEPQFYGIQSEYKVSDAETYPYNSWISEKFFIRNSPSGGFVPWAVMYHLDNDNWFTRKYIKSYSSIPYGAISTRNILDSFKNSSEQEFDDYACRLFLNELNFTLISSQNLKEEGYLYSRLTRDSISVSGASFPRINLFFSRSRRRVDNNLLTFNTDSLFAALLSIIKEDKSIPIEYLDVSEAFNAISYSPAFESAKLLNNLELIFQEYLNQNSYNWKTHSDLAQIYLKGQRYAEAEKEARIATQLTDIGTPYAYLIEALIMQDKLVDAASLILRTRDCIVDKANRKYYGYSSKTKSFSQPPSSSIYLGDLIVKDTSRFAFTETALSFIKCQLNGYGQDYSFSAAYYDRDRDKTILCTNSSNPKYYSSNWYSVVVRKGDYSSEEFDRITISNSSSLAVYFKGDKRGFLDLAGGDSLMVYPAIYDHAWVYSEGLAVVSRGNQLMFVDPHGEVKAKPNVPVFLDMDLVFKNGTLLYRVEGYQYGLLGKDGKWVLPPEYDSISESVNGYRLIEKNNLYGLIKNDGTIIVKPRYPHISVDEKYIRISLPDSEDTIAYPIEYASRLAQNME